MKAESNCQSNISTGFSSPGYTITTKMDSTASLRYAQLLGGSSSSSSNIGPKQAHWESGYSFMEQEGILEESLQYSEESSEVYPGLSHKQELSEKESGQKTGEKTVGNYVKKFVVSLAKYINGKRIQGKQKHL